MLTQYDVTYSMIFFLIKENTLLHFPTFFRRFFDDTLIYFLNNVSSLLMDLTSIRYLMFNTTYHAYNYHFVAFCFK